MWRKQNEEKPPVAPEPVRPAPPTSSGPAPAPPAPEPRAEGTRIAASLALKGEITGREDMYLDGTLEGSIRMPASRITIGPNARVSADVEAGEIIVEGRVTGNLTARTRVELRGASHVRGDLTAQRIAIHDGAWFNGKVEVTRPEGAGRGASTNSADEEALRAFTAS